MSQETNDAAVAVLKKAGIHGERGLVAIECTSRGLSAGEVIADIVPGADLLRKSRLIVVATDQNIYLFKGRRFGRIGERLATFPIAADVVGFDDENVVFPDDTRVFMTKHQARALIAACGGQLNYVRAGFALRRLGVKGEIGLGTASGIEPSTERSTIAGKVARGTERVKPVVDVSELTDYFDASKAEGRIALFSDRYVRLFEGRTIASMGRELGAFPVGTELDVTDAVVTFPNGEIVKFASAKTAQVVATVTRTGSEP